MNMYRVTNLEDHFPKPEGVIKFEKFIDAQDWVLLREGSWRIECSINEGKTYTTIAWREAGFWKGKLVLLEND